MASLVTTPRRVMRSASHRGTCPPWSGRSALPDLRGIDSHGFFEGAAYLHRLPGAMAKGLEPRLEQGIVLVFFERDAFDARLLGDVRQLDRARNIGIANHRLRLGALGHRIQFLEQALAHHGNAEIAGAEIFLA